MRIQMIILLGFVSLLVSGHGQRDPQVYCGRRLAQTLAMFCQSDNLVKRSDFNGIRFGYEPEFGWPWMAAARAQGLSGSRGKRGGGIVEECCDKPCSMEELLTYCN